MFLHFFRKLFGSKLLKALNSAFLSKNNCSNSLAPFLLAACFELFVSETIVWIAAIQCLIGVLVSRVACEHSIPHFVSFENILDLRKVFACLFQWLPVGLRPSSAPSEKLNMENRRKWRHAQFLWFQFLPSRFFWLVLWDSKFFPAHFLGDYRLDCRHSMPNSNPDTFGCF